VIIDRELSQREKISNKDLCILCYENGYYPQKANEYIEKLVKENRIVKEGNMVIPPYTKQVSEVS
jgi:hypothetical protein